MKRSPRRPRGLAKHWPGVAERVRSSPRVVVFLDFDGTLVDIVPRPEDVKLARATRRVLQVLARHPRATLVVLSGRRRAKLLRHIGIRDIFYYGLYGWERGRRSALPRASLTALERVRRQLATHLSSFPGIWIEDKYFSLSVHLLEVPPSMQPQARRKLRRILRPFRKTLRVIENLRDAEIVPHCISDKGVTIRRLLQKPKFADALPFYFGDDLSDEAAFKALGDGISIRVGATGPTHAQYAVRDPAEVTAILTKLKSSLK